MCLYIFMPVLYPLPIKTETDFGVDDVQCKNQIREKYINELCVHIYIITLLPCYILYYECKFENNNISVLENY